MKRPASPAGGMGPRRLAADALWIVHLFVMAFLTIGWALPWESAWWIYVLGAPFVVGGWQVFSDRCWLSILEAKLRGEPLSVRDLESEVEQSRSFVAETLSRMLGRPVSRRSAKSLSYGVVASGFVLAGARLAL